MTPTRDMVWVLSRAEVGALQADPLARWKCVRSGLLDRWDRITTAGRAVLNRYVGDSA